MSLPLPQDLDSEMDAIDIKVKIDCEVEEPFLASKSEANNDTDIVVGSCPKCSLTFKMHHFLLAHKLKCNRTKTRKRSKSTVVKKAKTSSTPIKLFACELCPKLYYTKQALIRHKETIHNIGPGATPSSCPHCPKILPNVVRLQGHILEKHRLKESSLGCTQCGTKFVEDNFLALHIKANNCESEPKTCPHCELAFGYKCSWKKHLEICDKLPLAFPCTFPNCSRIFTTRKRLVAHNFSAHPLPKPPPPPCPECGKQFSCKYSLQKHRKNHDPEHRHKKFNCKLHKFVRLANGSLSFPCPEHGCDKTFKSTRGLTFHQQSFHSGQRHACKHCGLSFTQKNNLNKHEKKHAFYKKERKTKNQDESDPRPEVQTKSRATIKSKTPVASNVSTFSCGSCHQTFGREISLQRHLKLNQAKNTTTKVCEFCSTKFDLECGFQFHIKDQFSCCNPKCDFGTNCEINYTKHKDSCSFHIVFPEKEQEVKVDYDISEDNNLVDSSSELVLDPGGPFYCWACGQLEFNLRTSFYNHIRIVHGQEPE